MLAMLHFLSAAPPCPCLLAQASVPLVVLVLCVVAGIGTVLLLPGRREASLRVIGAVVALAAGLIGVALLVRQAQHWSTGNVYFWVFSFIAVGSALRLITHTKPVYSALYFVLTVLAGAGLFVLLWADFMAAALVLIYAGAILVTYVFVIMLASQAQTGATARAESADYDRSSREPLAAAAVGFGMMGIMLFVLFEPSQPPVFAAASSTQPVGNAAEAGTARALGAFLFQNQLVNLELAGLLLTLAMVGAVVIARRRVSGAARLHGEELPAAVGGADGSEVLGPATPLSDDPHSIPVSGTDNPAAKAYPER